MTPLYLASKSPRRRELLSTLGIPFEIVDPDVGEETPPEFVPEEVVLELALRKARSALAKTTHGRILAADTVVAIDADVLGKPKDRADARSMLRRLSGTTHRVLTGVCLLEASSKRQRLASQTSFVTMRELSTTEIDDYVDSGECDDKAGAYAIQERGDRFVTELVGSWTNVVGLPMEIVSVWIKPLPRPR